MLHLRFHLALMPFKWLSTSSSLPLTFIIITTVMTMMLKTNRKKKQSEKWYKRMNLKGEENGVDFER